MGSRYINIMRGDYGFDNETVFQPLAQQCGITYNEPIVNTKKITESRSFFTETNDEDISLSTPKCDCLKQ